MTQTRKGRIWTLSEGQHIKYKVHQEQILTVECNQSKSDKYSKKKIPLTFCFDVVTPYKVIQVYLEQQ